MGVNWRCNKRLLLATMISNSVLFPPKENESDDDPQRVLLAIAVEIDDGCVEHIEMRAGDSPETVAMKFCLDHGLPEQFVAPLAEHIVSNIISLRSVAPLISSTLPSRASLR